MGMETKGDGVLAYLQPDNKACNPSSPAGRVNNQLFYEETKIVQLLVTRTWGCSNSVQQDERLHLSLQQYKQLNKVHKTQFPSKSSHNIHKTSFNGVLGCSNSAQQDDKGAEKGCSFESKKGF